jgi:dihydrodipicolinate reductase
MHVVGFDAPGESIELRVTARDRSAYVAGALLAADTALAEPDTPTGLSTFAELIDRLLTTTDQGGLR